MAGYLLYIKIIKTKQFKQNLNVHMSYSQTTSCLNAHIRMHTHARTHTRARAHTHNTHTRARARAHTHTHTHTHTFLNAHTRTRAHALSLPPPSLSLSLKWITQPVNPRNGQSPPQSAIQINHVKQQLDHQSSNHSGKKEKQYKAC